MKINSREALCAAIPRSSQYLTWLKLRHIPCYKIPYVGHGMKMRQHRSLSCHIASKFEDLSVSKLSLLNECEGDVC